MSYQSLCHLHQASCLLKKHITFDYDGQCSKYIRINPAEICNITSLKVNSVLERDQNQPFLTSLLSNLIYFDNGSMIQYYNYESYQNYEKAIKTMKSYQIYEQLSKAG